jgi:hypothetical protein
MSVALLDRLLDSVEAQDFNGDPDEEIVASALALLALAISRLPQTEREATLLGIEERHVLRQAVGMFPQRAGLPRVSNGHGAPH